MRIRAAALFVYPPAVEGNVDEPAVDGSCNPNALFGHLIVVMRDVIKPNLTLHAQRHQEILFGKNRGDGQDLESMREQLRRSFASLSVRCLPPASDSLRAYGNPDFNVNLAERDFYSATQDLVRTVHALQEQPRKIHGTVLTASVFAELFKSTVRALNDNASYLISTDVVIGLERQIVERLADATCQQFDAVTQNIRDIYDPVVFSAFVADQLTPDLHSFQRRIAYYQPSIRDSQQQRVLEAFNQTADIKIASNLREVAQVVDTAVQEEIQLFDQPFHGHFQDYWARHPVAVNNTIDHITVKYDRDLNSRCHSLRRNLRDRGIGASWSVVEPAITTLSNLMMQIRADVYEEFGRRHDAAVAADRLRARDQRREAFVNRMEGLMRQQRETWRRNLPATELSLADIAAEFRRQDGLGAYFEALRVSEVLDLLQQEPLSMSFELLYAEMLAAVRESAGKFVPHPRMRELSTEVAVIEALPERLQNRDRLAELKRQISELQGTRLSDAEFLRMKALVVARLERPDFFSLECPCPGWRGRNGRTVWRLEGYTMGRVNALVWNLLRSHVHREDGIVSYIDQMNESLTTNNGGEWCANGHTAHAIATIHGLIDLPDLEVDIFNMDTLLHIVLRNPHATVNAALTAGEQYMRSCGQVRDYINLMMEHLRIHVATEEEGL
jgi:hypothetical protein